MSPKSAKGDPPLAMSLTPIPLTLTLSRLVKVAITTKTTRGEAVQFTEIVEKLSFKSRTSNSGLEDLSTSCRITRSAVPYNIRKISNFGRFYEDLIFEHFLWVFLYLEEQDPPVYRS